MLPKERVGAEGNYPSWKADVKEKNPTQFIFLRVTSWKANVSGHTSVPSLHFQEFDGLCPEGNMFRDCERPFLAELKG